MNNNINILLEKYWKSETNLQEEAELRAYFSGNDIADEHLPYKDLFTFFSVKRLESTDLEVEKVLSSLSDINLLLNKYWDAETSLEEEAQLKNYFSGDDIAPEHQQYRDLFVYFGAQQSITMDNELNPHSSSDIDIDGLLEKYWKTETSLEEENMLKAYFSGEQIADRHMPYAEMFGTFSTLAHHTTDLDVSTVLANASEKSDNIRAIGSSTMPRQAKTRVFSLQKWATGIAAVFVLGFAAITVLNQEQQPKYKGQATVLDQEADAQEAYEITKEALAFLSKNMNKGSKTVVQSVSKAEKASIFK